MSYVKQSSVRDYLLRQYGNVFDRHVFDITFSRYPVDGDSSVDFPRCVRNEVSLPYAFYDFRFSGDDYPGPHFLTYVGDGSFIFDSYGSEFVCCPWYTVHEVPEQSTFRHSELTYDFQKFFFFRSLMNFCRYDSVVWHDISVIFGYPSQFKNMDVSLSYHHYRYYVSYYGFSFGDESDDRNFIRHVAVKTKDVREANDVFRALLLSVLDFFSLEVS